MQDRVVLRQLVRSLYDEQKMRIQCGNRISANVRASLSLKADTSTDNSAADTDAGAQELLKNLAAEYRRITDALATESVRKRLSELRKQPGVIFTPYEYELVGQYVAHLSREKELVEAITYLVEEFPIYREWLIDVAGCGPVMSAVLISEIAIERARHVSSLWKYAGLDVAPDGRGRSRRQEHLVPRMYTARDGSTKERLSITFNPLLKTKLLGVLAPSFLRQRKSPYKDIYYNYKHRLEHHATYKDATKAHRHMMAQRYMIKIFLKDLWLAWRELENLPVTQPYAQAKLGYQPHDAA